MHNIIVVYLPHGSSLKYLYVREVVKTKLYSTKS